MKIKYGIISAVIAIVAGVSGCFSPRAINSDHLVVDKVKFYKSGILEFSGRYDDGSWGISTLRGKIDGDTIILDGMTEFWGGEEQIAHRLAVPRRINAVKLGNKVIWKRETETTVSAVKDVPEKAVEKKTEKKINAAEVEKEDVPEVEPEKDAVSKKDDVKDESENTDIPVTHLKVGSAAAAVPMEVKFLGFEEIFWGINMAGTVSNGAHIRRFDSVDVKELNKYQDAEVLDIKGIPYAKIDLTGLSLPKLKRLVIDDGEVVGLPTVKLPELEEFYLSDTRTVPLGKIALPPTLPNLHTVGIQAFTGNFDFDSLAGKKIVRLNIHGDCFRFSFLRDMPLEELKFSGFTAGKGDLEVLKTLPLKHLKLAPHRPLNDWSFLSGMKLRILDVKCTAGSGFSPELLKNMPLEVLRITASSPENWDKAWESCRQLPLEELILRNAKVPGKFLMSKPIEKVALIHCAWHTADPIALLNRLTGVRHLAVWRMVQWQNNQAVQMMDQRLNWRRFTGKQIQSLCISNSDINFLQQLPAVKKLAVRECENSVIKMSQLRDRDFEILSLPPKVDSRHATVTGEAGIDRFFAAW